MRPNAVSECAVRRSIINQWAACLLACLLKALIFISLRLQCSVVCSTVCTSFWIGHGNSGAFLSQSPTLECVCVCVFVWTNRGDTSWLACCTPTVHPLSSRWMSVHFSWHCSKWCRLSSFVNYQNVTILGEYMFWTVLVPSYRDRKASVLLCWLCCALFKWDRLRWL